MKSKCLGGVSALVYSFMLFVSLLQAQDVKGQKNNCESLLVEQCGSCHYLSRVCHKLGKKSKGDWRRTVRRMVRKGAVLSEADQKLLVQCLYTQEDGVVTACKPYQ